MKQQERSFLVLVLAFVFLQFTSGQAPAQEKYLVLSNLRIVTDPISIKCGEKQQVNCSVDWEIRSEANPLGLGVISNISQWPLSINASLMDEDTGYDDLLKITTIKIPPGFTPTPNRPEPAVGSADTAIFSFTIACTVELTCDDCLVEGNETDPDLYITLRLPGDSDDFLSTENNLKSASCHCCSDSQQTSPGDNQEPSEPTPHATAPIPVTPRPGAITPVAQIPPATEIFEKPPDFVRAGENIYLHGSYTRAEYIRDGEPYPLPKESILTGDKDREASRFRVPESLEPGELTWVLTDEKGHKYEHFTMVYRVLAAQIDNEKLRSYQYAGFEYELDFGMGMATRKVMWEVNVSGPVELKDKPRPKPLKIDQSGHAYISGKIRAKKVPPGTETPFKITLDILRADK